MYLYFIGYVEKRAVAQATIQEQPKDWFRFFLKLFSLVP
jgi:hypothetical protein